MKKLLSILLILTLLMMFSVSGTALAQQDPDPTEEPTVEATEESRVAPTEEPTAEPTEEPTAEPTEEATAEPTEEATAEPTEEATAEPTEEATAEPTVESTVEPTAEPTTEPAIESGAAGDIGTQATYAGSWSSYISVQNMGASSTDILIDWYKENTSSACAQTNSGNANTTLGPSQSRRFFPPSGACGSSWNGSAVASGGTELAAVVTTMGSLGNLMSEYSSGGGSFAPTTEALIIPWLNNGSWDALVGISNAGSGQANVRVTLLQETGITFDSKDITIPAQGVRQLRLNTDFASGAWRGSVKIENIAPSNEPLFVVAKAERFTGPPTPITIAYEGIKESASSEMWMFPVVHKRTSNGSTANGQNQTLAFVNAGSQQTTVTVRFYNRDGSLQTTETIVLNANGSGSIVTRDTPGLGTGWSGYAVATTTVGRPVVALSQPWVQDPAKGGYTGWASFNPTDMTAANSGGTINTAYLPTIRKQSSGGVRTGDGHNVTIIVNNLDTVNPATVRIEVYDENAAPGVVAHTTNSLSIDPNGQSIWQSRDGSYDADLGTLFFGSAKVTVISGGPVVVTGQSSLGVYGTSDGYSFYNAIY